MQHAMSSCDHDANASGITDKSQEIYQTGTTIAAQSFSE